MSACMYGLCLRPVFFVAQNFAVVIFNFICKGFTDAELGRISMEIFRWALRWKC